MIDTMPDQHTPRRHTARLYPDVAARMADATEIPFDTWIQRGRVAGMSWRALARRVRGLIGISISHNTLANWYPDLDEATVSARRHELAQQVTP
jgi:hypothetical protein